MSASDHLNRTLFHGSPHPFNEGDEVKSLKSLGGKVSPTRFEAMGDDSMYIYATTNLSEAQRFANMRADGTDATPRVFEVEAFGDLETNGVHFGGGTPGIHYRSTTPMRVLREHRPE